ncbi:hypothetical protein FB45DRAFT_906194 [Roridomyces roridus]|uniref:BTB domain-containing protein n=1 Tax=Roridomyces roridus TaxID=1738132 RepID=A0AAD7C164_9AGAR|nr:hypothetical protein FB45DRAFT_906194 [Roridomyces roridus]
MDGPTLAPCAHRTTMSDSIPPPDFPPDAPAFELTHPFDKVAGADAILRSSDGVDFCVHRAILSLASPVFETMFRLPQPQPQDSNSGPIDLPVVDVSERSVALERALRFFYPGTHPDSKTLEELGEAIDVLMKYDVQCQVPALKHRLEHYHASSPLRVYAIAIRHGWKDAAVAAARESLKQPLRSFGDLPKELDAITGSAYHHLLQYHLTCGEVARSITASPTWFACPVNIFNYCGCPKAPVHVTFANNQAVIVSAWFHKYLTDTGDILNRCPGLSVTQAASFHAAMIHPSKCGHCQLFDFLGFATVLLPAQIQVELDKVELKF